MHTESIYRPHSRREKADAGRDNVITKTKSWENVTLDTQAQDTQFWSVEPQQGTGMQYQQWKFNKTCWISSDKTLQHDAKVKVTQSISTVSALLHQLPVREQEQKGDGNWKSGPCIKVLVAKCMQQLEADTRADNL